MMCVLNCVCVKNVSYNVFIVELLSFFTITIMRHLQEIGICNSCLNFLDQLFPCEYLHQSMMGMGK